MIGTGVGIVGVYFAYKIVKPMILPKVKGAWGEFLANRKLKKFAAKNSGTLLKDLLLCTPDGRTHQIDSVLVTRFGIFSVEIKNYTGSISGDMTHHNWTHTYGSSNQYSSSVYNIAMQNAGHIAAIKSVLNTQERIPMFNIVAVNNSCNIHNVKCDTAAVIHYGNIIRTLDLLIEHRAPMPPECVQSITECLESANITDRKARHLHVTRIQLAEHDRENGITDKTTLDALLSKSTIVDLRRENSTTPPQQHTESAPCVGPHSEPTYHGPMGEGNILVKIGNQTDTIGHFYNQAFHSSNGETAEKESASYLIDPVSKEILPVTEADNLYRGLWAVFFEKDPSIAIRLAMRHGYGSEYQQKVIQDYADDRTKFILDLKSSLWYQAAHQKSLNVRIQNAKAKQHEGQPAAPSLQQSR